jgi:hypothetical protein
VSFQHNTTTGLAQEKTLLFIRAGPQLHLLQ